MLAAGIYVPGILRRKGCLSVPTRMLMLIIQSQSPEVIIPIYFPLAMACDVGQQEILNPT